MQTNEIIVYCEVGDLPFRYSMSDFNLDRIFCLSSPITIKDTRSHNTAYYTDRIAEDGMPLAINPYMAVYSMDNNAVTLRDILLAATASPHFTSCDFEKMNCCYLTRIIRNGGIYGLYFEMTPTVL